MCDEFDFDELCDIINEYSEQDNVTSTNANEYKLCDDCGITMDSDINNSLICKQCGFIKQVSTENTEYEPSMNGYNTNSKFHIPIKYTGANSFQFQKQLRNSTSQYSIVQESNLRRKLDRLNFKSNSICIPKNIIEKVICQYKLIRETDKIHRGDIFNGIIGSLIYYECLKAGIVRKHKEISDWYGITESDLSKGDKIVRALEEKKVLKLPIYDNNDLKYVESYLKRSKINLGYQYFMMDLLQVVKAKRIGNHNARLSTKVSAVLYAVYICDKISTDNEFSLGRLDSIGQITPDEISKEFTISISTFKSFYLAIYKARAVPEIAEVLAEYGVTLTQKKVTRRSRKPEAVAE